MGIREQGLGPAEGFTVPSTTEIASEVDRLVIGVHRAVMSRHRSRLRDLAETLGVRSPGHLYDLAEFLAVGACSVDIAHHRFRYEPDNRAEAFVADLVGRQLLDERLRPADSLLEATATMLQWRADVAETLWGTDLDAASTGAARALSLASGTVVEAFRSLPEPDRSAHRLHHLLTGLRYARLDAHVAAWERAGLTAVDIVALSSAVASAPVSAVPAGLVARRWLTVHGSATAEGRAARSAIEAETNSHCDALFATAADRHGFSTATRGLRSVDD